MKDLENQEAQEIQKTQETPTMGSCIRTRRMALQLTQKQLAERLGVTDKAVSKWETGSSLPDITQLLPLAEILEIPVAELLSGLSEPSKDPRDHPDDPDSSGNLSPKRNIQLKFPKSKDIKKIRFWFFMGTSSMFLIAALVCWICDSALSNGRMLSWSLIVDLTLVCSWLVLLPLFAAKRRLVLWTLTVFSLVIFPWIFLLSWLLSEPGLIRFGCCITPLVLLFLWCTYFICRKAYGQNRKWRTAAILCVFMALLECCLDIMIARLLSEPIWPEWSAIKIGKYILSVLPAGICFVADHLVRTA